MKLLSQKYNSAYAGQTIHFPVIGDATFESNGLLEVDDDSVIEFIELTKDSFNFKKYIKPGDKTVKLTKEEKEALKLGEEHKATKDQLESLNFEQLVELAKEGEIPLESLAGLSDGQLRKVLFDKMTTK